MKTDVVDAFIEKAPDSHKKTLADLRDAISGNLPEGFAETVLNDMISFVVPHEVYSPGNHLNPGEPLPFIELALRSDHILLSHMGMKFMSGLVSLFVNDLQKYPGEKPGMGQNTVKFSTEVEVPKEAVGSLCRKLPVDEWIEIYRDHVGQ